MQTFEVAESDLLKMQSQTIFDSEGKGALISGVSVALQLGRSVYMGAFSGYRLIRIDWKQ